MAAKARWLLLGLAFASCSCLSSAAPVSATSLLSVAASMRKANLSDSVGIVPSTVPHNVSAFICQFLHRTAHELRTHAATYLTGEVRDLDTARQKSSNNISAEEAELMPWQRRMGELAERTMDRIRNARRCAVVSNSGVLLHHKHGASIDAPETDLVFRFNDAQIGGELTDHVGSRDDIRILNFMLSGFGGPDKKFDHYVSPNTSTEFPVFVPRRAAVLKDPLKVAETMMRGTFGDMDGPGRAQTTGLQGVLLAMSLCEQVFAYGFPDTENSAHAPFHYFGKMQHGSANVNPEQVHAKVAHLEKRLYTMMAINSDVNASDVAVIPGFRTLQCGEVETVTGQSHDL
mmetsp:Transcript_17070/g.39846  ORF Transcript_17070/g.39846 Transcript_17070/m.39846 type:complete len:345 (-) Transcript_17070:49-1083(-)